MDSMAMQVMELGIGNQFGSPVTKPVSTPGSGKSSRRRSPTLGRRSNRHEGRRSRSRGRSSRGRSNRSRSNSHYDYWSRADCMRKAARLRERRERMRSYSRSRSRGRHDRLRGRRDRMRSYSHSRSRGRHDRMRSYSCSRSRGQNDRFGGKPKRYEGKFFQGTMPQGVRTYADLPSGLIMEGLHILDPAR